MYEHVICINPLNLTLRSSTPDFFTRLGFEGILVFWNCALPLEGEGGATQSFTSPLARKTFLISLLVTLNQAGMLRKNKVMELYISILG